jgi:hypothetical protein
MYAGFFIAFFIFVFASFVRRSDLLRCLLLVVGFLTLLCQGGCFMVLGGIGTATGGSNVGADRMMIPVKWAIIIAFAWSLVLIYFMALKKDKNESQNSGQGKNPPENESDVQRPED